MIKLKQILTEGKSVGEFVRFGGLSPVKQKGYNPNFDGFHSPPTRKGIYAFPKGYIETFLLGGGYGNPKKKDASNRLVYVKDKDGKKITDEHPDFNKYDDNDNIWSVETGLKNGAEPDEDGEFWHDDKHHALVKKVHPRRFKYSGEIWHHHKEFVPPKKILTEKGSWVKTDMETYLHAFVRNAHSAKKEMRQMMGRQGKDKEFSMSDADSRADPLKFFTKDHLEVFIERVK